MTIDVDSPPRAESRSVSFERLRVTQRGLGEFSLRIYSPSEQQIDDMGFEPHIGVAYGPGWAQGLDATNDVARRLARDGHFRVAAVKLPDGEHDVADMVPFHTDVLRTASEAMLELYPTTPLVISGYSRGSSPAAIVAGEMGDRIAGVTFIAPTWFSGEPTPRELARRGIEEAIEAIRHESPRDRFDLIRLGWHATKEMVRRPWELRRDVAAIAGQSRPKDLIEQLESVEHIGVVAGDHDGVCPPADILEVAAAIADSDPSREVDVRTVRSGHFHVFTNPESRNQIIRQIYKIAA